MNLLDFIFNTVRCKTCGVSVVYLQTLTGKVACEATVSQVVTRDGKRVNGYRPHEGCGR